ncbi:MAG: sterol desaturase family protein [Deltaproteobacteria bacterium]|nr:sterol desaturase family protein [Deltaproteobacteria bacterium]
MDIIALSIPVFFALMGLEVGYALLSGRALYRLNDSLNDLACGVINQVVGVFSSVLIFGFYVGVYNAAHLFEIPGDTWWAWGLCILGVDFGYYWFHRMSHEVNFLWVTHVVHHQSEEYNLSVALRQGAIEPWATWVFYLPLALLGFPPLMFLTANALNTLYQFWVHTRAIDRLGPLEAVFNTPSHHRVHHGCDPKYLDRNYSGFLIIWDRIFGTFQAEEEEPTYGLVTPLASWNPLWANVKFPVRVWRHARTLPTLRQRLGIWFQGPKAIPGLTGAVAGRTKYDASLSGGAVAYVVLLFVLGLAVAVLLLFTPDQLARWQQALGAAFVVLSLVGIGAIYEQKRWSRGLEVARWASLPVVLWLLVPSLL